MSEEINVKEVETEPTGEEAEIPEVEEEEEEVPEEDIPEAELKESKALWKLLKDPRTRDQTISILANQAGILKPPTTETQVKSQKKSILKIVEDNLGEEFKFIAPKLGKAIEEALEQERESTEEGLKETRLTTIQTQVDSTLARLNKETNGASRKLENQIANLVKRYPQPDGTSLYDYLKDMYVMAGGKVSNSSTAKITQKIQQNAKDVPGRLRTAASAAGGTEPIPQQIKKMGLKAIVVQAMKDMEK